MGFFDVVWIVIGGALIGVLARLVLPGRQRVPWWAVIGAGIVGMLAGDALSRVLGVDDTRGFDWMRHGLQILVGAGAVALASAAFNRGRSTAG